MWPRENQRPFAGPGTLVLEGADGLRGHPPEMHTVFAEGAVLPLLSIH